MLKEHACLHSLAERCSAHICKLLTEQEFSDLFPISDSRERRFNLEGKKGNIKAILEV